MSLMARFTTSHDRAAGDPDRDPGPGPGTTNDLSDALDGLRLSGAIFLRGEYTESWGFESMSSSDLGRLLAPTARRLILFHVVAAGHCWVETDGSERLWAGAGDVIVLPYGDDHRMGGSQEAELVSAASLVAPPPWSEMPVIQHGLGGDPTEVVCGYLVSDDPLFDPRLQALPQVFVVSPPTGTARSFVAASFAYALQQTSQVDVDRIAAPTDVAQLLLREVLRLHLERAPSSQHGWLRALRDPVLAPAMGRIHADPGHHWTVADLAATAHVSASVLDERFRTVLAMPPIRYLSEWRMHLARGLLASSDATVTVVARRVGYESEEAFSRAFKRAHGSAPTRWRRDTHRP